MGWVFGDLPWADLGWTGRGGSEMGRARGVSGALASGRSIQGGLCPKATCEVGSQGTWRWGAAFSAIVGCVITVGYSPLGCDLRAALPPKCQ